MCVRLCDASFLRVALLESIIKLGRIRERYRPLHNNMTLTSPHTLPKSIIDNAYHQRRDKQTIGSCRLRDRENGTGNIASLSQRQLNARYWNARYLSTLFLLVILCAFKVK
jgi:hypothetical protein